MNLFHDNTVNSIFYLLKRENLKIFCMFVKFVECVHGKLSIQLDIFWKQTLNKTSRQYQDHYRLGDDAKELLKKKMNGICWKHLEVKTCRAQKALTLDDPGTMDAENLWLNQWLRISILRPVFVTNFPFVSIFLTDPTTLHRGVNPCLTRYNVPE